MEENENKQLTRREMLKVSGAIAAGSVLAAVGPAANVTAEVSQQTQAAAEPVSEVYPPYGVPSIKPLVPPKRLDTLDGKTICGVGNTFHFEETWAVMVDILKKKYPTAKFIGPDVFNKIGTDTDTVLAALPDAAKKNKCDAFIVGNGC